MRKANWILASVGTIAIGGLCWQWFFPAPNNLQLPQLPEPSAPREVASSSEVLPTELIDLSNAYEPVSDEDRIPTLSELMLVAESPGTAIKKPNEQAEPEVWDLQKDLMMPFTKGEKGIPLPSKMPLP